MSELCVRERLTEFEMNECLFRFKKLAEAGNEGAETLLASAYIYAELREYLPEDFKSRRLFIKHQRGWDYTFPDKACGRAVTEAVVNHFISEVLELGLSSAYVQYLLSPEVNPVSGRNTAYSGKSRLLDEYFLVWDLAFLYYLQKNYLPAAYLFTCAMSIEDFLQSIDVIKESKRLSFRDVCNLENRKIARAQYMLGEVLERGSSQIPRSYEDAAIYYASAVLGENDAAMTNLGIMYHEGRGLSKDDTMARAFLEWAVDLGNKKAADYIEKHLTEKKMIVNYTNTIVLQPGAIANRCNFSPVHPTLEQLKSAQVNSHSHIVIEEGAIVNRSSIG